MSWMSLTYSTEAANEPGPLSEIWLQIGPNYSPLEGEFGIG